MGINKWEKSNRSTPCLSAFSAANSHNCPPGNVLGCIVEGLTWLACKAPSVLLRATVVTHQLSSVSSGLLLVLLLHHIHFLPRLYQCYLW